MFAGRFPAKDVRRLKRTSRGTRPRAAPFPDRQGRYSFSVVATRRKTAHTFRFAPQSPSSKDSASRPELSSFSIFFLAYFPLRPAFHLRRRGRADRVRRTRG